MTLMGLPHSEISGSKRACRSPKHIVACHVLHRLSVPRHSPSTLSNLTIKCLDLMRSAVESYGFTLHFFNYNPYSIVNELKVAKTNAEPESLWTRAHRLSRGFALLCLLRNPELPGMEQLVELDGIEPTTPCLQSRCSPN
jgi:hypothetical protein